MLKFYVVLEVFLEDLLPTIYIILVDVSNCFLLNVNYLLLLM